MARCGESVGSIQESKEKIGRQTPEFCPSVWGDYFISFSPSPSTLPQQQVEKRRKEMKIEVKAMLEDDSDAMKTLSLIDDLQRLGLEYHFEQEIDELLGLVQTTDTQNSDDIHFVALRFRLLRQQGRHVPSDVFKKFKDEEGMFMKELSCDAKGLLYLYEASWLGTREEEILDEAMDFTRCHLERLMSQTNNNILESQIQRALEMPIYRGMRRLDARHYIAICSEDRARSSDVLLEFAKLDFNLLQSLHQSEIKAISVWWREMGLVEKLSFARNRVVECYFWSLGVHFEPQQSQARLFLAKMIALASVMDDMFDAYGTLEELHLFNDVIQRWDFRDVHQLPEYMSVYLISFTSVLTEIEEFLNRKEMCCHMHYLVESIKGLVRAYFEEAKWASEGYVPTLEEYLNISVMSSGYPMLICATLIITEEEVTKDVLDLMLTSVPKVVEASALIARLMDDLVSTKLEQERKHVVSSLQCYVNDHGVSEQEAHLRISKMTADSWKDLNKECLKSRPSQKHLNMIALNFARMIEVIYKHEDGYTNPSGKTKDNIALLLVKPLQD